MWYLLLMTMQVMQVMPSELVTRSFYARFAEEPAEHYVCQSRSCRDECHNRAVEKLLSEEFFPKVLAGIIVSYASQREYVTVNFKGPKSSLICQIPIHTLERQKFLEVGALFRQARLFMKSESFPMLTTVTATNAEATDRWGVASDDEVVRGTPYVGGKLPSEDVVNEDALMPLKATENAPTYSFVCEKDDLIDLEKKKYLADEKEIQSHKKNKTLWWQDPAYGTSQEYYGFRLEEESSGLLLELSLCRFRSGRRAMFPFAFMRDAIGQLKKNFCYDAGDKIWYYTPMLSGPGNVVASKNFIVPRVHVITGTDQEGADCGIFVIRDRDRFFNGFVYCHEVIFPTPERVTSLGHTCRGGMSGCWTKLLEK